MAYHSDFRLHSPIPAGSKQPDRNTTESGGWAETGTLCRLAHPIQLGFQTRLHSDTVSYHFIQVQEQPHDISQWRRIQWAEKQTACGINTHTGLFTWHCAWTPLEPLLILGIIWINMRYLRGATSGLAKTLPTETSLGDYHLPQTSCWDSHLMDSCSQHRLTILFSLTIYRIEISALKLSNNLTIHVWCRDPLLDTQNFRSTAMGYMFPQGQVTSQTKLAYYNSDQLNIRNPDRAFFLWAWTPRHLWDLWLLHSKIMVLLTDLQKLLSHGYSGPWHVHFAWCYPPGSYVPLLSSQDIYAEKSFMG